MNASELCRNLWASSETVSLILTVLGIHFYSVCMFRYMCQISNFAMCMLYITWCNTYNACIDLFYTILSSQRCLFLILFTSPCTQSFFFYHVNITRRSSKDTVGYSQDRNLLIPPPLPPPSQDFLLKIC